MPRKPLNPTTDDTDYDPGEQPSRRPVAAAAPEPTAAPEPQAAPASANGQQKVSRLRRGWSAANSQIDKNSSYAQAFKPEDNITYVVKFLESDPYVTFNRHWVRRPSQKGGTVNIPFTCLRSEGIDQPCPLCDVLGDAPKSVTSFNIAVVEKDGSVSLKSFDCTAKTFKTIQNYSRESLYSPITKRWWVVRKVKDSRGYNEFQIQPVMSDASLHDDYGWTVPSPNDLAELDLYEPDIVTVRSSSELMEVAKEMQAQDEYNPYGET